MNTLILDLLEKQQLFEPQIYKNLAVLPFKHQNGNKLEYVTLDDALERGFIEIKEISESGSVPELFVENISDSRVLLLDGEELVGAKQNRILNATILLEKGTKTTIPVSCVEQSRWSYKEKNFKSSSTVFPCYARSEKMSSVNFYLSESKGTRYDSDQSGVWNEVSRISRKANVKSATNAMSDVFENKKSELEMFIANFKHVESQNGFFVFINEKPVGMEYISNVSVFDKLSKKILNGYAMEAILDSKPADNVDYIKQKNEFVDLVINSESNYYKSIGLGDDHRMNSDKITASALIVEEEIVHFSALQRLKTENEYKTKFFINRYYR